MRPVLVVGAGPAGLSVCKHFQELNLSWTLVDRSGAVGGSYAKMCSEIHLSSPARYLMLPGSASKQSASHFTAGSYASYLKDYADQNRLVPDHKYLVRLQRDAGYPPTFRAAFSDGSKESYAIVVLCTGSFDHPFMPSIPGLTIEGDIAAARHCHISAWKGPSKASGESVLIVGDGISAVEAAEKYVEAGFRPTISAKRMPLRLRPAKVLEVDPRMILYPMMAYTPRWLFDRQCRDGWQHRPIDRGIGRYIREGLVSVRPAIVRARGRQITFADATEVEPNLVIFATGYEFKFDFLPEDMQSGASRGDSFLDGESNTWPNLFSLGMPCTFGINSHFVFGITHDARKIATTVATRLRE